MEISEQGSDKLIVTGLADLDGVLRIEPIDGFVPEVGQSFDLFDFNEVSGQFSEISAPSWLGLDVSSLETDGSFTVTYIPEPSSLTLAGIAAIGLLLFSRRRRNNRV